MVASVNESKKKELNLLLFNSTSLNDDKLVISLLVASL